MVKQTYEKRRHCYNTKENTCAGVGRVMRVSSARRFICSYGVVDTSLSHFKLFSWLTLYGSDFSWSLRKGFLFFNIAIFRCPLSYNIINDFIIELGKIWCKFNWYNSQVMRNYNNLLGDIYLWFRKFKNQPFETRIFKHQ